MNQSDFVPGAGVTGASRGVHSLWQPLKQHRPSLVQSASFLHRSSRLSHTPSRPWVNCSHTARRLGTSLGATKTTSKIIATIFNKTDT